MKRTMMISAVAVTMMLGATALPALAQGTAQTVALMSIDPQTIATGYRATKVVGSAVLDETGTKIGTVDDLIITPADQVPFVILSVGGFLGIGEKHIAVLGSSVDVVDGKIVLKGATKASLSALPAYIYTK
jgi:sporulation protein YlmC with PRC-barrel domain